MSKNVEKCRKMSENVVVACGGDLLYVHDDFALVHVLIPFNDRHPLIFEPEIIGSQKVRVLGG